MIIDELCLDVASKMSQCVVCAKQGETARRLIVTLRNGNVPYTIDGDAVAVLSAETASGATLYNNCEIIDNKIIYTFTEGTAADVGSYDADIVLQKNGKTLVSATFTMQIEKRAGSAAAVVGSDEYKQLDSMIKEFKALTADAERFTVDKEYTPTSEHAQSGLAVNEAFVRFANGLKGSPNLQCFDTLENIIAVINSGSVEDYIGTTEELSAGYVYLDADNIPNVVIERDINLAGITSIFADMILNLNGKCITLASGARLEVKAGANVKFDGRVEGSKIEKSVDSSVAVEALVYNYGVLDVDGGNYFITVNTSTKNTYGIVSHKGGRTIIKNAKFKSNGSVSTNKGISCVYVNGYCEIDNCDMELYVWSGGGYCVYNGGELVISKTKTFADAGAGSAGLTDECGISHGILVVGITTIIDCDVYGTHSGVNARGGVNIKGGTYKGTGHGGAYFTCLGSGASSYVENATIASAKYEGNHKAEYRYPTIDQGVIVDGQYDIAGFYVGGDAGANISVYLDNCQIVGGNQSAFVLRGTSGEQNNSVYMSNCTVSGENKNVRIDNDTHRLYIGFGNNITAEDTDLPEAVVTTDDIYIMEE